MDIDSLQQATQQAGMGALFVSFLAGLVFSFNPVALAALPVSLAYVTKAREPRQVVIYAGMFIAGMLAIHVLLGAAAGFGGQGVQKLLGRYWGLLLGTWMILMGLLWPGWWGRGFAVVLLIWLGAEINASYWRGKAYGEWLRTHPTPDARANNDN